MQLVEDVAEAVPGEPAGALFEVAVEQRPDAQPERRYQFRPGLLQPAGEQLAGSAGVGGERLEPAAVRAVVDALPASP